MPFAISVTDREDVFVAKMTDSLQIPSNSVKSVFLASAVSNIASTIKSLSAKSLYTPVFKLPLMEATASAVLLPFAANLS